MRGKSRIRVRGFEIFLPQIFHQHSLHPCPYTAPSPRSASHRTSLSRSLARSCNTCLQSTTSSGASLTSRFTRRNWSIAWTVLNTEVPVTVTHDSFSKIYFVDALIRGSSLFEFKAADAIHPRHRGQTLTV